jgi:hypothetical protein
VADHADGDDCTGDEECRSGSCADGVCCATSCREDCERCDDPATPGVCVPVDVGTDPRRRCQAAVGGHPSCAGACDGTGQCAFPDVGAGCGQCAACDGTGRCTATPADDPTCGVIECDGLDTACRSYRDLTANRCAALGFCHTANDPAACVVYDDLPCADGGPATADGPPPTEAGGPDAGDGNPSGGCAAARGTGGPEPLEPLVLLGAVLVVTVVGRAARRRHGPERSRRGRMLY